MGQQISRRTLLTAGAGLAAAGGLALAAGGAGATLTHGPGRNGVGRGRPVRGGSVTIGVNAEEQGFNPATARLDQTGFLYARTLFDPLMAVTASGAVVPYLAESVTPNATYDQWTITARPGITFHDGTPLDGAALLANVEAQYTSALTGVALQPLVASYAQSGPLSVTLTMKNPWVTFPYTLAQQQIAFVAAPSMLSAPNGGTDHPVGTGPFVFSEWVPNDHFTATANPHYWRAGLPHLASITFRPIPDAGARVEALQSGTVDLIHADEAQQIAQLRAMSSLAYADNSGAMVGSPSVNCLMLNCATAPFDDPGARLALAKAIDRHAYSAIIDQGVNAPADGIYQPGSPYYAPTGYPAYDPAGAKKLVAAYRARHGQPLTFALNAVASPAYTRIAQYLQAKFQAVGVAMSIKTIEQSQIIDQALFGSYQATQWNQFGAVSPDLNYIWFSTTTVNDTGISINMARNVDPRIETAMQTGMQSTSAAARVAAFRRVNELLAQDLPYLWSDRSTWALASNPAVQNWNNPTTPSGTPAVGNDQGTFWLAQIWKSTSS